MVVVGAAFRAFLSQASLAFSLFLSLSFGVGGHGFAFQHIPIDEAGSRRFTDLADMGWRFWVGGRTGRFRISRWGLVYDFSWLPLHGFFSLSFPASCFFSIGKHPSSSFVRPPSGAYLALESRRRRRPPDGGRSSNLFGLERMPDGGRVSTVWRMPEKANHH